MLKKNGLLRFPIFLISMLFVMNAPAVDKSCADAVIETKFGVIELQLLSDLAPRHVENFRKLASSKFYDGTLFHRVIPGFMIQGGDPNSRNANRSMHGTGGPGYGIKAEFNDQPHVRGTLSMARSQDPDSAGSQFFIVVKESKFLDRQYTVFGKVISGMEVVDKIVAQKRDQRDNPFEPIAMTVRIRAEPIEAGDANTEAGDANTEAGDANTEAGDANTEAGDANTEAGDANTEAGDANTEGTDTSLGN